MLGAPLRRCNQIKLKNYGAFPINGNIGQIIASIVIRMNYSKGKDICCQDVAQTAGKKVEPWPKPDPPPPAWRAECPKDPQPPNYDPYRIKVPDVVVPPLPPSNAKWIGVLLTSTGTQGPDSGGFQQQQHQQQGYQAPQQSEMEEENKNESIMGLLKGFFDKLRGKTGKGENEASMKDIRADHSLYLYEIPDEDARDLFRGPEINFAYGSNPIQDMFHNSPIIHPDYWKNKPEKKLNEVTKEELPKLGYHGRNKYKYAFHEPWRPLDRLGLLEQAEKEEMVVEDDSAAVKSE